MMKFTSRGIVCLIFMFISLLIIFEIFRHETIHCQSSGLISVADGGQLGNQLSEYASLLAASKVINATPVISEVMRKKLVAVFPYFTFPVLNCLNHSMPIKWTHIKTGKIQNLTTPISKQTLRHYLHSSNAS